MDATDQDRDIVIQKSSADLIADFDRSLGPFLRKPNGQLRRRVRVRETSRLTSQLLEPFQELPQLLDPQLPKWLPVLASAYLECLRDRWRSKSMSLRSQLLAPLPDAICRIIYTFCKIRGEKVVVRFLNVETRYLEPLLLAIEDSERESSTAAKPDLATSWTWHERYVVLLWLSQLFFAPFDLSTISSGDADDLDQAIVAGFHWPPQVPGITLRVVPLATRYLGSPGKERDGAKALLVRLAMRRDMQEVGILEALVHWALSTLKPTKDAVTESPYYYIGSLSFLAGVLGASADTSIMDSYLSSIFYATQAISTEDNAVFNVINGSALARKMMIKVTRSVITLILRKHEQTMADTEMVEASIGYFLERLADNDTPVRLTASKALSIITLKLDSDMASQVIDAVLESLNRNVLWVKNKANPSALPTRDLTAVDPLEWHGLMLTLSHLLYRRSPPPESLSDIIHALLVGLSFEKRNSSGGFIGTNVRDASCFGIWALARRYSTPELLRVPTKYVLVARGHDPSASILQVIATELVVTASLDPAGNIRRGASAALQELIGRHPDTVEKGISVVQTVDYHAVALRSRAIHEVSLQATRLSTHYGRALLEANLGWRGIGDLDAGARRVAATSFGTLTAEMVNHGASDATEHISTSIELLLSRLEALQVRQVEERHGLLLSLAAVFDHIPPIIRSKEQSERFPVSKFLNALKGILQDSKTVKYRKPELVVEAVGRLIVSSTPILVMSVMQHGQLETSIESGPSVVNEANPAPIATTAGLVDKLQSDRPEQVDELLGTLEDAVSIWLDRNEPEVTKASSEAALVLLIFSSPSNRNRIIRAWCDRVCLPQVPRNKHGNGYFHALTRSYSLAAFLEETESTLSENVLVSRVLAERWGRDEDIETRVALLRSLVDRAILKGQTLDFVGVISDGLDNYTTNARGDIGSHVRLEAIKATKTLWGSQGQGGEQTLYSVLFPRILRLAAEKLDRVRVEAQSTLAMLLHSSYREEFNQLSFSSKEYFSFLFRLCTAEKLDPTIAAGWAVSVEECTCALLAGLVTSADTGNEDLVIVSRAALTEFCEESYENLRRACTGLINNLKRYAGQDRVVIPTLEVVSYLFHVGLLQRCYHHDDLNLRQLCLLVQKAAYKTGNVRKLEACIKVYGAIAAVDVHVDADKDAVAGQAPDTVAEGGQTTTAISELAQKKQQGIYDARRRLGALMLHPWPKVRAQVVDELWDIMGDDKSEAPDVTQKQEKLLSVDWGRAEKSHVKRIVGELGLE
ncbi:tubulin folding cofactor D C terminal-domain-containing protein [Biscogniauxia mediterranea]|nr:tubulin folding cofactor D C terminal-domain-containing protein [Biscogniauxia mediterranea]